MRLGLVAERYGAEAAGELPARARLLAEGLQSRGHAVTVFTSTALDPVTAESVLPSGRTREGGIDVVRSPGGGAAVSRREVDALWFFGHEHPALRDALEGAEVPCVVTVASEGAAPPPEPWVLERASLVFFSCVEERERASRGRPRVGGEVLGYGVVPLPLPVEPGAAGVSDAGRTGLGAYVVHAGALEARDGCAVAVEQFLRFQRETRSSLSLVLVGRGRVELHENPHVRLLGDLDPEERRRVIAGARAALLPSRREALAPLLLEAWNEARPVLVCSPNRVLRGTVERTGGGLAYEGYDELAGVLERLERDAVMADALGAAGRRALEAEHAWPGVLDRGEQALRGIVSGRTAA